MSVELLNPAHSSSSSFAPFAKEEMSYSKSSNRIRVKGIRFSVSVVAGF